MNKIKNMKFIKIIIKEPTYATFALYLQCSSTLIIIEGSNNEIMISQTISHDFEFKNFMKENNLQECYIRVGHIPENERSKNHQTECYENGVSCFRGAIDSNGECYPIIENHKDISTLCPLDGIFNSNDVPVYIIDGNETGFGSDGEPLLLDIFVKKRIYPKIFELISTEEN